METRNEILKTKQCQSNGKCYYARFTKEDEAEMKLNADVCKLNGLNVERYLELIGRRLSRDWKDEAMEIYQASNPELKEGIGATLNLYSDRRAMTVVKVVSPRKIEVAENDTKCIDFYGNEYEILDTVEENRLRSVFTLRKGGIWVQEGQPKKYGSVTLTVGFRVHSIDPSF